MTDFDPLDPEVRKTFIGASDVPIIMGVSPWKSPLALWEEKIGISQDRTDNHHVRRGKEYESCALNKFEELVPGVFMPCFKRDERVSWMAANLDGYDMASHTLVEIKCPSPTSFAKIVSEDDIPTMYQYQMCWQKHVSKAEKCYFFAYECNSDNYYMKEFNPPEGMFDELFEECEYFWDCVKKGQPPEGSERHYPVFDNDELKDHAVKLLNLQEEIREKEKEAKEIKKNLILAIGGESANIGHLTLEKTFRKGAVDYSAIKELEGVDLEAYRKNPSEVWRLK